MAPSPSAQYSLTLRVEIDHRPGMLGKVASAIGDAGATIGAVDLVHVDGAYTVRDITVDTGDSSDWPRLTAAVDSIDGARVLDTTDRTFMLHAGGKIELQNKSPLKTRDDLSMAYTPGVARVCAAIHADPDKAFQYTIKRNTVAVVSDGTAVLGLGDIGPRAAMPVMEGKAMLFKEFAGVDAFPICLDTAVGLRWRLAPPAFVRSGGAPWPANAGARGEQACRPGACRRRTPGIEGGEARAKAGGRGPSRTNPA